MGRRHPFRAVLPVLFIGMVLLVGAAPAADAEGEEFGVFVRLADGLESVPVAFERLEEAAVEMGWEVLGSYDVATPLDGCSYAARVLVLVSPAYTRTLMMYGSGAAFAAPVRMAVFQDEEGVHLAATNPLNLNRTIVDELVPGSAWASWANQLSSLTEAAFPGQSQWLEYGAHRDEGRIGKTFGIMAGGPFTDQVETVATTSEGETVEAVAIRLYAALAEPAADSDWGIHSVYRTSLDADHWIVGVTGARLEREAFLIVGSGGVDARKDMACPGLDHAPAFPIELLVTRDGDGVAVRLVDEMYRMKMFFEDAGKMAFAKNMGMPGSIEDEIRERVEAALR